MTKIPNRWDIVFYIPTLDLLMATNKLKSNHISHLTAHDTSRWF